MPSDFSVKFYGCRGSIPVSGKQYARYGGATSCVVVSVGDRDIVLDAGSGILDYGKARLAHYATTREPLTTYIFVTHTHFDHLIGLPYFAPMFMPDSTVYLWGPRTARFESFEDSIETLIQSPYYPVDLHEMQAEKIFHDVSEADVVYILKDSLEPIQARPRHPRFAGSLPRDEDVLCEIHCMRGYSHPKCGVNIYKVVHEGRSVVYATDTEGFVHGDRRLMRFAKDAEVLIHDAMYTEDRYVAMPMPTQGYGHSTVEIATTLARESGVKKLFLFHHEPASSDEDLDRIDALGKSLFAASAVAVDGLEVKL
ncbi:MAG: MBL fold metallo-hydrolase [Bradymonadaceae bacterium]|nr:MBL fold metallo-hydrolase [Lujinxingiaceae bacterium]